MKKSIYLTDQPTIDQVDRMAAGQATRAEAAAALGITVGTLNSRLCRTKFNERLKGVRAKPTDAQALHLFQADPDKAKVYDEALRTALQNPAMKVRRLHEQYPSTSYQMLARKVKAARENAPNPAQ